MKLSSLFIFRFTKNFDISEADLNEALEKDKAVPIGANESFRKGFIPPANVYDGPLSRWVNGCALVTIQTEERKIPAKTLNAYLDKEVQRIESEEGEKIPRKRKAQVKDDLVQSMLPGILPAIDITTGYFDIPNQLLIVGASSEKKAEDFASTLRQSLGSLPIRPISYLEPSDFMLTAYLKGNQQLPSPFSMDGGMIALVDPGDSTTKVKFENISTTDNELLSYLDTMRVHKTSMTWDESVSFAIDDGSTIKSLKLGEDLFEEVYDIDSDDSLAIHDATMGIFTSTVASIIDGLKDVFGGEDTAAIVSDE